jgi:hypothetical protein
MLGTTPRQAWTRLLVLALCASGCENGTMLSGDGSGDGDAASDETAMESGVETFDSGGPDDSVTEDAGSEDAGGGCCAPPSILDERLGICVDPTGTGAGCDDLTNLCPFGQVCTPRWGIAELPPECELPCSSPDFLCPVGYVCDPPRCCDYPGQGCIRDTCAPPLLMQIGPDTCVSVEGLHGSCSTGAECATGQACVTYTGEAGDEFRSCEIVCTTERRLCPNGYICVDVADGPQNVCERLPGFPRGCDDPGARVCGSPDKFASFDRESVCSACADGIVFCARTDRLADVELATGATCGVPSPAGTCGAEQTPCALPWGRERDCPAAVVSDRFWSLACRGASLDSVTSVECLLAEP